VPFLFKIKWEGYHIPEEKKMPKKATILVIDDELNLRRTLAFILQQAGYLVVTAADGLDALGAWYRGASTYYLSICNFQM
jgi:CheY-like chemotaxis protein